jgi:hypothetical protein
MKPPNIGSRVFGAAFLSLIAATASAAPKGQREVVVPLTAEPVDANQMQPRTVELGEIFLIQKLLPLKSATLRNDTHVPLLLGSATLPQGTHLLWAKPRDGAAELYCGVSLATESFGRGQIRRWLCLEDADHDMVFETAYEAPPDNGAFLPAFEKVGQPRAISGAYSLDPENDRFGFEVGFSYQPTKARSGLGDVVEKVRAPADEKWSELLSGDVQSLTGYSTWISGVDFPEDVRLDRARFLVTEGDRSHIRVEPQSVSTGDLAFTVRRCKGFGLKC